MRQRPCPVKTRFWSSRQGIGSKQTVNRQIAKPLVRGLVLTKQGLSGKAEAGQEADRRYVFQIHLGDDLSLSFRLDKVANQRRSAFAGHALALAISAGHIADFCNTLFVAGDRHEAPCHFALFVFGNSGAPVPSGLREPFP